MVQAHELIMLYKIRLAFPVMATQAKLHLHVNRDVTE